MKRVIGIAVLQKAVAAETFKLQIIHVVSPIECRYHKKDPESRNFKSHDVSPFRDFMRSDEERYMVCF